MKYEIEELFLSYGCTCYSVWSINKKGKETWIGDFKHKADASRFIKVKKKEDQSREYNDWYSSYIKQWDGSGELK